MDVVAHIGRGSHLGHLPGVPLAHQIGAEARLLERAEWVGDDEFADRNAGRPAPEARRAGRSGSSIVHRARTRAAGPSRPLHRPRRRCRSRRRRAARASPAAPRQSCACWRRAPRPRRTRPNDSRRPVRHDGRGDPSCRSGTDRETCRRQNSGRRRIRRHRRVRAPAPRADRRGNHRATAQRGGHLMPRRLQCPRKPQAGKRARPGQQNVHGHPRNAAAIGPAGSKSGHSRSFADISIGASGHSMPKLGSSKRTPRSHCGA